MVRREPDGSFRGYQFDGRGFVRWLQGQGHDLKGREALLVGAMAIAFALAGVGAKSLTTANRTPDNAEKLAHELNEADSAMVYRAGPAEPKPGQLVINATSLGMRPGNLLPVDAEAIDDTLTIAEVVAKPEITHLLELAAARGARTHSGLHMTHGQVGLIADHLIELWA